MTGAPVPDGATRWSCWSTRGGGTRGRDRRRRPDRAKHQPARLGSPRRRRGAAAGVRIDYSYAALGASIGRTRLKVFHRPEVAIVATGDEIVPVDPPPSLSRFATPTPLRWPRRSPAPAAFPAIFRSCATTSTTPAGAGMGVRIRPGADFGGCLAGQIRRGGTGPGEPGSGILFRPRRHATRPAARCSAGLAASSSSAFPATPPPPW